MKALGDPQDEFPAVHIAGTNGKGSVAMMTANALWTSGVRAGLYTSPHLSNLTERFQIKGRQMSDSDLSRLTKKIRNALAAGSLGFKSLTQFEFLTALAFFWFAERRVPLAVVEVGLGGRLDATNVLGDVRVSVITTIGFDHMAWLGSTISKISSEKAGIMKPSVPIVTGTQGEALSVIRRAAKSKEAPLIVVEKSSFRPSLRFLKGDHQKLNAALALETLNRLRLSGFSLGKWGIIRGIQDAHWPGRYELFRVRVGKKWRRVILDGAHNPEAALALARTIRTEEKKPVTLLFGVLQDKSVKPMARALAPLAKTVIVTAVPSDRSADPKKIAALKIWKGKAILEMDTRRAFKRALQENPETTLVIAGSLYLIGFLRPLLKEKS